MQKVMVFPGGHPSSTNRAQRCSTAVIGQAVFSTWYGSLGLWYVATGKQDWIIQIKLFALNSDFPHTVFK